MDAPSWCAQYIGIPYASFGRTREGADCLGLVRLVLREQFGLEMPAYDVEWYDAGDRREVARRLREGAESALWQTVPAGQECPGDVVLLALLGHPAHVGVVAVKGWMLHIEGGINSVMERYDHPRWGRRVMGFFRYVG